MIAVKDMDMPCDCWNCDCTYEDNRGKRFVFLLESLYATWLHNREGIEIVR